MLMCFRHHKVSHVTECWTPQSNHRDTFFSFLYKLIIHGGGGGLVRNFKLHPGTIPMLIHSWGLLASQCPHASSVATSNMKCLWIKMLGMLVILLMNGRVDSQCSPESGKSLC